MYKKILQEWQILKIGRRTDFLIITIITAIFLIVITMNIRLIFQMTSNQTEEIGQMQLESIRSDLQGTIAHAENVTIRLSLEAEQMIKSGVPLNEIEKFFYRQKSEQKDLTNGVCFNVYIASKDWTIIPDFNMPADYHAPERLWYIGAQENPDKVYITEPYIDAMTGDMCFTMSKMLSDNETVVGIDFNFSDVQQSILQMRKTIDRNALIVTKNGMIIGYTDMELVGKKVSEKLPEFESILNRIVNSNLHESFTAQFDGSEHTIFSSATNNGWYMIVSVDSWAFYKDSYFQIFFTTILSLAMMIAIIFFYLNAMKNGLHAENALHVKEEFLSHLSRDLRDPLKNILKLSSSNPSEAAVKVRESALQLSDMMDNLFSYSTIVSKDRKNLSDGKYFQDEGLAKVSKYARVGIISVLIVAMIFSLGICISTTISWGDTKMNREVDTYDHQLANWLGKQRSILSMFVNLIGKHPELMRDYNSAVSFLNDIAAEYPEISVCYLANPYNEHTLIMNNGWEPSDANWHVEKRRWYIDTAKNEGKFTVSAPYYDAQTGLYCMTLSQTVLGDNNEFIGIFGIDFYIDSLVKVLGESYTKDGYAFLVDSNGIILNHPNNNYQMSTTRMTDVFGTEYGIVYSNNKVAMLKDYSGNYVACLGKKNDTSDFTVIVANSWWNIYGNIILLSGFFIGLLIICIVIVNTLISHLLSWQDSVNSKLKEASDVAVAASQSKSQFLAQMSHEIRTPINAVLGMNEMILRESKNEEILEYATNIQSAGRTLLSLINSILDFSKIEDGKMEILPVRYETLILIDDLVNMISEKANKKGLDFKTEIDFNLPKILYGDDVRLRQIITNILTNAVKYTHEGYVILKMNGREIDADTFELHVEVSDTGIGIRAEDVNKLFQSFLRLDEARNRNIEGTGLGISIVQKLLDMMGSKLEVTSVYGQGSTFSFKLIQKIIDESPVGNYDEHSIKRADNSDKKFLKTKGARILAVDDNSMNLKVLSGLLKRNGIVPDLADSGKNCIKMVQKNFYHIIFLDNMMPVMNGVETLQNLRKENILSDKTAVIMLTASAITGLKEKYLKEGFDDYLTKPIDVVELESMLEKYLPDEIISFEDEESAEKISEQHAQIEENIVEEKIAEPVQEEISEPIQEEISDEDFFDEDDFSSRERKKFAEICPDINLDTGLTYCMNSKSFYTEILHDYKEPSTADKMQAAFDSDDIKNYQILVHTLKSTSLSIGAEALSEKAKNLELAAKENNWEKIKANHEDLMTTYRNVREQISNWLEENSNE